MIAINISPLIISSLIWTPKKQLKLRSVAPAHDVTLQVGWPTDSVGRLLVERPAGVRLIVILTEATYLRQHRKLMRKLLGCRRDVRQFNWLCCKQIDRNRTRVVETAENSASRDDKLYNLNFLLEPVDSTMSLFTSLSLTCIPTSPLDSAT